LEVSFKVSDRQRLYNPPGSGTNRATILEGVMAETGEGEIMRKQLCEQFLTECEHAALKMGVDFYEIMKKAPVIMERWKPYYLTAQKVWENAKNRDDAIRFLLASPDPNPEQFDKVLAFMGTLPHFLRGSLQDAAKSLPPSPGGRPHELTHDQRREVCKQIGYLYGEGVALSDAKKRMAQRYAVSLRTIQRAWQERATRSSDSPG
jgi:hypothetical protein